MRSLSFLLLLCAICSTGLAQPGRSTSKAPRPMFPGGIRLGMTVAEVSRALALPPLSATVAFDESANGERVVSYRVAQVYGVASNNWDCMFNSSGKLVMVSAPMAAEGIEANTAPFRILGDSLTALLGTPTSSAEMVEQSIDAAEKAMDSVITAEGKSTRSFDSYDEAIEDAKLERSEEELGPFMSWEIPISKSESALSFLYLDTETKILSISMSVLKAEPSIRTKRRGR